MNPHCKFFLALLALSSASMTSVARAASSVTWHADNGNGTYTNPLFYDEFSDPDIIRVGNDYYMTGTSMHAMPGLALLHSKDLVNWSFISYAEQTLDLGPAFRLENGQNIYGRGIWAPCLRYHDGKFYIFSNVNGQTTQVFTSSDPRGPWVRTAMKRSFHDLSVLFDDDGKVYVVWNFDEIHLAELNTDLTDIVPGSERIIIPKGAGMGEGSHLYKIDGKYFITSADYRGHMRLAAARADHIEGPYEINPAISIDEDFGLAQGNHLQDGKVVHGDAHVVGRLSLHQGGVVETPSGQWWGFSMMDYNSVGRLTALSPITWKDGWPYFGLPGNLTRTPRTWVKPDTGTTVAPHAPYNRNDTFSASQLNPVWQWNHVPLDAAWSLSERPGFLRLHARPATSLWDARNTLTQRAIGPQSQPTIKLDISGLRAGDVAGLALLNKPFAWIGVEKTEDGADVAQFDETTGQFVRTPLRASVLWLRADCDFITEKAVFSYSTDGVHFKPLGPALDMVFQLTTFQGIRYSLFSYTVGPNTGGYADFDSIVVKEPHPHGLMRPIPYNRTISLSSGEGSLPPGRFRVIDMGLGRVALKSHKGFVTVAGDSTVSFSRGHPGTAESFQWIETPNGDLVLMSLASHRFLRIDPQTQVISADSPGPLPDGSDGDRFTWKTID